MDIDTSKRNISLYNQDFLSLALEITNSINTWLANEYGPTSVITIMQENYRADLKYHNET